MVICKKRDLGQRLYNLTVASVDGVLYNGTEENQPRVKVQVAGIRHYLVARRSMRVRLVDDGSVGT